MDSERFDSLVRSLGARRNRRNVVKSFGAAALGAAGVIGLRGSVGAAKGEKVSICHLNEYGTYDYISVSSNAIPAHAAHGDVIAPDFATDVENCGACGNVCSAPENATAFCGEAGCGFECNAGSQPDGNGGCAVTETGCVAVLSGTADGGIFCVDDEMQIYVNGALAFQHTGTTGCFVPIPLGTVADGDLIQVVANNSAVTCGDISIDPLYLICQNTGAVQALDPVGYPGGTQAGCGVVFYDQTFTVEI